MILVDRKLGLWQENKPVTCTDPGWPRILEVHSNIFKSTRHFIGRQHSRPLGGRLRPRIRACEHSGSCLTLRTRSALIAGQVLPNIHSKIVLWQLIYQGRRNQWEWRKRRVRKRDKAKLGYNFRWGPSHSLSLRGALEHNGTEWFAPPSSRGARFHTPAAINHRLQA